MEEVTCQPDIFTKLLNFLNVWETIIMGEYIASFSIAYIMGRGHVNLIFLLDLDGNVI